MRLLSLFLAAAALLCSATSAEARIGERRAARLENRLHRVDSRQAARRPAAVMLVPVPQLPPQTPAAPYSPAPYPPGAKK